MKQYFIEVAAGCTTLLLLFLSKKAFNFFKQKWSAIKTFFAYFVTILFAFIAPVYLLIDMYIREPFNKNYLIKFSFNVLLLCFNSFILITGHLFSHIVKDVIEDDKKYALELMKVAEKMKIVNEGLNKNSQQIDLIKNIQEVKDTFENRLPS